MATRVLTLLIFLALLVLCHTEEGLICVDEVCHQAESVDQILQEKNVDHALERSDANDDKSNNKEEDEKNTQERRLEVPEVASRITLLDADNINATIHSKSSFVILMYHGRRNKDLWDNFAANYEQVAEQFEPRSFKFGRMDCHKSQCEVVIRKQPYPFLIIVERGRLEAEYSGPITYDAVSRWLQEQEQARPIHLINIAQIQRLMQTEETALIGLYSASSPEEEIFRSLVPHVKASARAAYITDASLFPLLQAGEQERAIVAKNWRGLYVYPASGEWTAYGIYTWAAAYLGRLVSLDAPVAFLEDDRDIAMLVALLRDDHGDYEAVRNAAATAGSILYYAYHESKYASLAKRFHMKPAPSVIIVDKKAEKYYRMESMFSEGNIAQFVNDYKGGAIAPVRHSLEASSDGLIPSISRNEWTSRVLGQKNPVIVRFYIPSNMLSIRSDQMLNRVANYARTTHRSLSFYNYDVINNDLPDGVSLSNFPAIVLYKGGESEPISLLDETFQGLLLGLSKELNETWVLDSESEESSPYSSLFRNAMSKQP